MYIVLFLHQTTTSTPSAFFKACCISYYSYIKPQLFLIFIFIQLCCISYYSYIKPQLSFVVVVFPSSCISYYSYIKPQPIFVNQYRGDRCISYYSYIKPQPCNSMMFFLWVVYRTIPTSNHNLLWHRGASQKVVYRTIPTSNHNFLNVIIKLQTLYIVLFLHQTTTIKKLLKLLLSCISYYSYIKPQLLPLQHSSKRVVYRTIPTSNHNFS